jgi:hypothetical protein
MAFLRKTLRRNEVKASPCVRPFWIGKFSHKDLPVRTLPYVSSKHILISLTSYMCTRNSTKILYNTFLLTESDLISNRCVTSELTLTICNNSFYVWLEKLRNQHFRKFLETYTPHSIPSESTLEKILSLHIMKIC